MKYLLAFLMVISVFKIYSQPQRPITKEAVRELKKNEPSLWYVDSLPPTIKLDTLPDNYYQTLPDSLKNKKVVRTKQRENFEIAPWFATGVKWFFWAMLIVGVIAMVVFGNFGKILVGKNTQINEVITEESNVEDLSRSETNDFVQQIQRAKENQNYRLATRIYYLWTIKLLSDKNLIRFHRSKTNFEYGIDLQRTAFYQSFKECTRFYDYLWFGEFPIEATDFEVIERNFKGLLSKIS